MPSIICRLCLSYMSQEGGIPLHIAAGCGDTHVEITRLLLDHESPACAVDSVSISSYTYMYLDIDV